MSRVKAYSITQKERKKTEADCCSWKNKWKNLSLIILYAFSKWCHAWETIRLLISYEREANASQQRQRVIEDDKNIKKDRDQITITTTTELHNPFTPVEKTT